jgi:deazaflavin-dependent oxidoreductase (nitroreductase family)
MACLPAARPTVTCLRKYACMLRRSGRTRREDQTRRHDGSAPESLGPMSTQTVVPHSIRSPHVKRPALLSDRQSRLARLLFRSPIWLYRLGLGWIFGHQFLLLTHAGRRTGRIRETVLKVIQYDPLTRESIVASAWGEQTDWYRNIQARGALSVRTGGEWYVPGQRILSPDEAAAVFEDWTRRQRWFARLMLAQVGQPLDLTETGRAALVARFPFVAFSPAGDQPPSSGSST